MRPVILGICAALIASGTAGAWAQVYRCGNTSVFTDKPCGGASPVDVRANIMDAGPRRIFDPVPPAVPAPAIILRAEPKPVAPSGSLWDRRDAADAEFRNRTGPYRP